MAQRGIIRRDAFCVSLIHKVPVFGSLYCFVCEGHRFLVLPRCVSACFERIVPGLELTISGIIQPAGICLFASFKMF